MAELTAFRYHPGASILHRVDPRFKLGCLIIASMGVLNGGAAALGLWSLASAALFAKMRIPLMTVVRELRYFALLILLVVLARTLTAAGEPVIRLWGVALTRQGLIEGALAGWRLGLVVMLGLLFVATTRTWQAKSAVEALLKPVPFIPHKRVAAMMGLLLRFVPLILSTARDTADAQRSRGIENRRNPVFRLIKLAVPLLRKTFLDADRLATAMDARCYTENRSTHPLCARGADWAFLGAACGLSFLALSLSCF